jgi:glycine hydroxymethyltransferase
MNLKQTDPQIAELIQLETRRQSDTLELIASENHVSAAVMEAAGSVLTNKYAEGYPGARYYGGCQYYVDVVEQPWRSTGPRSCSAARFANVQPHSAAAKANLCVHSWPW